MKKIMYVALVLLAVSCGKETAFDAQGTFEATEVVVSSEASGRIMRLDAEEGTQINANTVVGEIDSLQLDLQRKQLIAQQTALLGSRPDVQKQVATIKEQIAKQKVELARFANMLKDGATTQKQYDDMEAHLRVLESQLDATLSTLTKNTVTINNNSAALEAQILALEDRIAKCRVVSPVSGTVLVKYAEVGELATMGKPLFKVADLNKIYLENGQLNVEKFGRGFAWLDTGTHKSLLEASQFVQTIENNQGIKIACLEEIALRKGFLDKNDILKNAQQYKKNEYFQYVVEVCERF